MSINHKRISLSIASGMLLELINKLSPLLILHHAQRNLGVTGFGWAQYQLAFFESIQPFITFGFANFALADVASHKHDQDKVQNLFTHILILKLINAFVVTIVYLTSYFSQGNSATDQYSFDILAVVILAGIFDTYWYCIARHKLAFMTLLSGFLRVFALILILTLVRNPQDKHLFVGLSLVPNTFIAVVSFLYAKQNLKFVSILVGQLKGILLKATPFALIIALVTVLDRVDLFLVEKSFGMTDAGIYAGPAKVIQSLSMIISSIALPFYAEILNVHDPKSLAKHVTLSLWIMSVLIAPVIFGLPFIADDVIRLLFSDYPSSAASLLSLLSISMIGSVFLAVFGLQILMARARPWAIIRATLFAFVVIFAVYYFGHKKLGITAAAYSMIAGKLTLGFLCVLAAREFLTMIPWRSFFKPLFAGLGMGLILKFFTVDSMFANLILGGVSYMSFLIIINYRELREVMEHPKVKALRSRWRS